MTNLEALARHLEHIHQVADVAARVAYTLAAAPDEVPLTTEQQARLVVHVDGLDAQVEQLAEGLAALLPAPTPEPLSPSIDPGTRIGIAIPPSASP